MGGLADILQWIQNLEARSRNSYNAGVSTNVHDSIHGSVEQQNQLWQNRMKPIREKMPWLFLNDANGYAPDEMMLMKNPGFMTVQSEGMEDVNSASKNPQAGRMTGAELDKMILDQMLVNYQKRRQLNRGTL